MTFTIIDCLWKINNKGLLPVEVRDFFLKSAAQEKIFAIKGSWWRCFNTIVYNMYPKGAAFRMDSYSKLHSWWIHTQTFVHYFISMALLCTTYSVTTFELIMWKSSFVKGLCCWVTPWLCLNSCRTSCIFAHASYWLNWTKFKLKRCHSATTSQTLQKLATIHLCR